MAVQGPDADPRLLGDGLHGRPAALLGEHLPCRRHEPLVVAPGVRPHGAGRLVLVQRSTVAVAVVSVAPSSLAFLPCQNSLAKRRHPPYTNRRKLPLTQNTSGKIGINAPHISLLLPRPWRPTARAGPDAWRLLSNPSVFLFVILTAQLMVVLDTTIVNVALPHIQEGLGFSGTGLSWVLNAYLLTFGGLLLLGARSGDLLGRRRTFLVGIALFTVSSLLRRVRRLGLDAARRPGPPGRRRGARRARPRWRC